MIRLAIVQLIWTVGQSCVLTANEKEMQYLLFRRELRPRVPANREKLLFNRTEVTLRTEDSSCVPYIVWYAKRTLLYSSEHVLLFRFPLSPIVARTDVLFVYVHSHASQTISDWEKHCVAYHDQINLF